MSIRNLILFVLLAFPMTLYADSCSLPDAMTRFNQLPLQEKRLLLQSCQETYTSGVGWTNSATGCGKCPASYSTTGIEYKTADSLGVLQRSILESYSKNMTSSAIEKVRHLGMIVDPTFPTNLQMYTQTIFASPNLGESISASLNETIYTKRTGFYSECIVPLFDFRAESWGAVMTIQKNTPLCKLKEKDREFHGTYINHVKESHDQYFSVGNTLERKKDLINLCQKNMMGSCAKQKTDKDFYFGTGFVFDNRLPNVSFIYRGKDGQKIWLEVVSNGSSSEHAVNISPDENIFECNGVAMEFVGADDRAITLKVNEHQSGEVSSGVCGDLISGDFQID